MRADRLLSILLLLQANRRMTAGTLARRLEVSPRTIHRDMEALSAAGVPVYAERGTGGGWVLPETYRTNLPGLTEAEAQAVVLAGPPRLLADLGLSAASNAAWIKLLAALPEISRRTAEHARQRIHVDLAGWRGSRDAAPFLPVLQDAVWRDRRLRLVYQRADGTGTERVVDPLGLVAKGRLWYLIAAVEGEVRTYRASRVQAAEVLDEPSMRQPEFDLAAYWAASSSGFVAALPRYPIVARVAPEVLRQLEGVGLYAQVERVEGADGRGWPVVHVLLETPEQACVYVLTFGTRLEVLEPRELRDNVVALAESVAAFYGRCSG